MSHHHNHDHSGHAHGSHDHGHDHSHDDAQADASAQSIIWKPIDFEGIRTLNETTTDSGAQVVEKTWPQRLNPEPELVSDADEQLLMFVPFTGSIKLHSILIRTSGSSSAPRTLHLFHNNDTLDFSSASSVSPTQTLTLSQTSEIQDIPVKRASFNNAYNLTLFFSNNFGDEVSRITYLAFKGEWKDLKREAVEVLYEKAANPKDHQLAAGIGERGLSSNRHGM